MSRSGRSRLGLIFAKRAFEVLANEKSSEEKCSNVRRWLPDMDLNHDKQIQSLLCYRYTIGQRRELSTLAFSY